MRMLAKVGCKAKTESISQHTKEVELFMGEIMDACSTIAKWMDAFDVMRKNDVRPVIIHCPLYKNKILSIEILLNNGLKRKVLDFFMFAEVVRKLFNMDEIIVVFHADVSKKTLERLDVYGDLILEIEKLVRAYPNVVISLENTMIFHRLGDEYEIGGTNITNNIDIVKDLRDRYLNVFATIDTCHYISDYEITMKVLEPTTIKRPKTLIETIQENYGVINNYHLSKAYNYGLQAGHGAPIDCCNHSSIMEFLIAYDKFKLGNVPVVLEVSEYDNSRGDNFIISKETLDNALRG